MPTSRRGAIKRKHTAIMNALDKCMGWTLELMNMFKEYHPDYAEGYENILTMLNQIHAFVEKMRGFI